MLLTGFRGVHDADLMVPVNVRRLQLAHVPHDSGGGRAGPGFYLFRILTRDSDQRRARTEPLWHRHPMLVGGAMALRTNSLLRRDDRMSLDPIGFGGPGTTPR